MFGRVCVAIRAGAGIRNNLWTRKVKGNFEGRIGYAGAEGDGGSGIVIEDGPWVFAACRIRSQRVTDLFSG